jgi:hypothetical protein
LAICYADGVNNSQPKKRLPLGRIARLTFRTLALAMLLLLLVSWVASYLGELSIATRIGKDRILLLTASLGRFAATAIATEKSPPLVFGQPRPQLWTFDFVPHDASTRSWSVLKPFAFEVTDLGWVRGFVSAPYWFLTTLAAAASALSFRHLAVHHAPVADRDDRRGVAAGRCGLVDGGLAANALEFTEIS